MHRQASTGTRGGLPEEGREASRHRQTTQTDKQTHRETNRRGHGQMDKQTDRHGFSGNATTQPYLCGRRGGGYLCQLQLPGRGPRAEHNHHKDCAVRQT